MAHPRFHLDHLFARRRLSAYVDDDLATREHTRVSRHLAECAECGRVERSLRGLVAVLRGLRGPRPAHLADDAVERVRTSETHGQRR